VKKEKRLKICLVASGGGHLRQILQLESFFTRHDYYIVTEDTPLARSTAEIHPVRFVPHFAFGQRKLRSPWVFLLSGLRNWSKALYILLREWPDVVISTGAGGAFSTLLWAFLTLRKVVYIETIARVEKPSLFGNMAKHLAHLHLVQWPDLLDHWPSAVYCDPLRIYTDRTPAKKKQILLTIGTFVPFDRMVREVERLCETGFIEEPVKAQIGASALTPQSMDSFADCSYEELNRLMEESEIVICHGGSGSLLSALKAGCKIVAVPRLVEHGEVYDNHQLQLIRAFEARGLVEAAYSEKDIGAALERARHASPRRVEIDTGDIVEQIEILLGLRPAVESERREQPRSPTVLHVCHHYPRKGGIERYVASLCRGIAPRYNPKVLVCHDTLRSASRRVEHIPVTWVGTWFYLFRTSISPLFPKYLKRTAADILHFHLPHPLAVLSYFLVRPEGKVVVTYHMDVVRQRFLNQAYRPLANWLLRRSRAIIVSSPNYVETSAILKKHRERCVVIPFGHDESEAPEPEFVEKRRRDILQEHGERIILFVGRITYYKGLSVLIQAMSGIEGRLLIIGSGPLEKRLKRRVRDLDLEDRIRLLGWLSDRELYAYYRSARVFVLPSVERSEAFGLVLLEAQAAGVPCVTTEIGTGTSYVNRQDETGFVVPPRSPQALQEAITRLLDDDALHARMSEAARRNVRERFTRQLMVVKTIALYDRLLAPSSREA